MKQLRALWMRWCGMFGKDRRERELAEEMESHLQLHIDDNLRAGMTAEQARRHALIKLGGIEATKDLYRERRGIPLLETLVQDLRYGLRALRKNPGMTLVAVLALGLGIGVNTTMFTIVSSLLSFRMGVDDVSRLVSVQMHDTGEEGFPAGPVLTDLAPQVKTLDVLTAYTLFPASVSDGNTLPERYTCVQITAAGFALIARGPILGRALSPNDEQSNAPAVVILTHRLWQNRYGSNGAVIGKTIHVNGASRTIIGVMPAGIQFPEDTDLWMPLTKADLANLRVFAFLGRLAPGAKKAAAQAEMDTLARNVTHNHPDKYKGIVAEVHPFLEVIGVYGLRNLMRVMLAAVTFVLLIACADVANLLLARAASRTKEISIRLAIGAGRTRIVRQLLTESVVLACLGGLVGWLIATAGLRGFDRFLKANGGVTPSWADFSMNTTALLYLAAVSLGTGILFGLAPALRLANTDIHGGVKDGGLAGGRLRSGRLAGALVVFEMVLCVVLLSGAGLLIRSTLHLYDLPLGADSENVLTMQINLPEAQYPRSQDLVAFYARLKQQLEGVPGVETVANGSALPGFPFGLRDYRFEIEGIAGQRSEGRGAIVSADYFPVLRANPIRGRVFLDSARTETVVSESFAKHFWPHDDALGKHLRIVRDQVPGPWTTIVGVVPNIQYDISPRADGSPIFYLPYASDPQPRAFIAARTALPPGTLAETFQREVQKLDPDLAAFAILTLEQRVSESRLNVGMISALFTIFAAIAFALGFVGLYAVMAHSVSKRTQEIGLRVAIGGSRRHILSMVLGQGMRQVAMGLAIGLPLAVAATRVLRSTLVGVEPGDPITMTTVALMLVLAGILGCAIPARRAISVDPVVALRHE